MPEKGKNMIFESHAHYEDEQFHGDREELFRKLSDEGIGYVVNVSSSLDTMKKTIALTEKYSFIYGTVGIHPEESGELTEENFTLVGEMSERSKVVAIGEIGLDYYWDEPEREIQKKWFSKQMELARQRKLPMVIHSRDAAKDTLDMMKDHNAQDMGGVIHCFSYSKEMAREFLNMGFYLGIGGVVTFSSGKKLKEVVEYVPLESIVLETDSPYLAPVPNRGKRNTSLNLTYVAREISRIKGITYDQVVKTTFENAMKMYRIERR